MSPSLHGTPARVFGAALVALATLTGCARSPSPLAPHLEGSIGMPHRGVLTRGAALRCGDRTIACLRDNGRHFALPRFVAAIERAAERVERQRPGATLVVGDLSAETGGRVSSHGSHRTGRDADLLLYMTTLDGTPTATKDFVHVGSDGLAWDPVERRYLRFDVEREWLLLKALLEDPEARVQWLFASRPVRAMLLEWAIARGEPGETIARAMDVLAQPAPPAQNHDDHVHVRTACTPAEIARGCEPTGPERAWIAELDTRRPRAEEPLDDATIDLVQAIVRPISDESLAVTANDVGTIL